SRIERMRTISCPAMLGITYHHIAYRLYVEAVTANGETIRGLHFVRSDADNGIICALGNMFTDFKFHFSRVDMRTTSRQVRLRIEDWVGSGEMLAVANP